MTQIKAESFGASVDWKGIRWEKNVVIAGLSHNLTMGMNAVQNVFSYMKSMILARCARYVLGVC